MTTETEPAPQPAEPLAEAGSLPPAMPESSAPSPAAGGRGWVIPVAVLALMNVAILAGLGYLAQRPGPSADARQAELTAHLAALGQRVGALEAAAGKPTAAEASLGARIDALEAARANPPAAQAAAPDVSDAVNTLTARVAALESKPAAAPAAGADKPALDALDKRLAALESQRATGDLTVTARLDALARDLSGRASAGALQTAESRITALESADNRKLAQSAALALAASLLGDKVRAGLPFAQELATVGRLMAPAPALTLLNSLAAQGIPSKEALASSFPAAARAARLADEPAETGMLGTIRHTLGALVIVRTPGASTENGLDAMAKAVGRDDPVAAINAAGALTPKARAAIEPWISHVRQRAAALSAVDSLRLSALNALERATTP